MSALPKHEQESVLAEQLTADEGQTQLPVGIPQVLSPGAARILNYIHPEQFSAVTPTEDESEPAEELTPASIREKFDKPPRQEVTPWYIKLAKPVLPKPKPVEPSRRLTLSDRLGDVEYPEPKTESAAEPENQVEAVEEAAPVIAAEPSRLSLDGLKKIVPLFNRAKEGVIAARKKVRDSFSMPELSMPEMNFKLPEINLDLPEINAKERAVNVKSWFGREIKEHRKATVVVLGLGGAALAAFLASKGSMPHLGSENVQSHVQDHTPKATSQPTEAGINHFDAVHQAMIAIRVTNAHHIAKTVQKAKEFKESLSFSGDTVWSHVSAHLQAKLGHMPSNEMVQKVTDKVLKSNHWSWDKAAHLPKGTIVHIQEKFLTIKHGSAKIGS